MEKPALERIVSPEELDTRLVVVSSKGWIALFLTALIVLLAIFWSIFGVIPNTYETQAIYLNNEGFDIIHSGFKGHVDEIFVSDGDHVKKGQHLLGITQEKSTKDTSYVDATVDGKVVDIYIDKGLYLEKGDLLMLIEKEEGYYQFFAFVPIVRSQQIKAGMTVYIQPYGISAQNYGSIEATVKAISPFVASEADLLRLLGNIPLISYLTNNQPCMVVSIAPKKDPSTISGLKWTSGFGPPNLITPQTIGKGLFILDDRKPISYILPIWKFKKVEYSAQ